MSIIHIEHGIARHPDWRMATPIDLDIQEGEQIAIVGDNAAGKSRLVEVIVGHYPLLQNEVQYCFGKGDKRLVSENLKYLSFRDSYGEQDGTYYYQQRWNQHDIDQDTPTAGELLEKAFAGQTSLKGKLCKMFHLENLLDKYIISLSSGELRKFQLTRALVKEPKVLILDNPFIGLDAPTRDFLKELLATLIQETGMTVILVLSKTDEIPSFVTHVLPIQNLHLCAKKTREAFEKEQLTIPSPMLNEKKRDWILQLSKKNTQNNIDGDSEENEILNFQHVSIRYGKRTILKDLSWIVHQGEHWALSGENGSGKSTLLSLVCADNPQGYACDIRLFGRKRGSGESIWEIKKRIGYVSPEMHRAYLKDLPAIDIVASGLNDSIGLYCRPKPEQRVICQTWMDIFGIKNIADRTFLKLSSGEQRLCLLARAFVKDPELLILDEPLHGLDMKNRTLVKEVIETFCQRPEKTLIMVTHYQEELPPCINHSMWLDKQN